ncbi:MAG: amino-acid N-acetyltransferase [Gammaproteobacteria bacterium]|nr:amino-acid N-acetyltransferase [Gammaproteobacteria bacterium]
MNQPLEQQTFVRWFRDFSPYINAFRGRTFVIAFGGEVIAEAQFASMVHDIALLNSLGVRLVLVSGARPQIARRLEERGVEMHYVNGLRVTDAAALACVKEATGTVRVEIEALLSMGLANSPMAGARIRVASGNFVTAKPLGVRDGVDYLHTGEVRRIDTEALGRQLNEGAIVLLPPLGYSPTGEVFNLSAEDVATEAAVSLHADKLIYLLDSPGLQREDGTLIRQLNLKEAADYLHTAHTLNEALGRALDSARYACAKGVKRAHLIDRHLDGSLLMELFTRDGIGTLISARGYEDIRQATIDDVGGILELLAPLENEGVLVRRSRERLETEIDHFTVVERDGTIIGCAALYPFTEEGFGELACLAVRDEYRKEGRGDTLLDYITLQARARHINRLFVLTTRTAHWFQERGFEAAPIDELPVARQQLYNLQRRSKVFIKAI